MSKFELRCESTGITYSSSFDFHACPDTEEPLEVVYGSALTQEDFEAFQKHTDRAGIDRFRSALPVSNDRCMVTLGEGQTPLVHHARLNEQMGMNDLWVKNESANPSWSFKDRLNAVNATVAREHGFSGIVASSTGNHGASAAADAAAAGLDSIVLFPYGTPQIYLDQVSAYGGRAIAMNWKERGDALQRLVEEFGWFPSKSSLPAPITNPYGLEGYKTIAYEIASDLGPSGIPEYVFIPIGSGDDYIGISRGFLELKSAGLIDQIPTFVACEAAGASPMADAVASGSDHISAIQNPRTIAVSISEGIVSNLALRALKATSGQTCTVSEGEITAASVMYAQNGFVAESSSCVALAAAAQFKDTKQMGKDARSVVILTGTGIRWASQMPRNAAQPTSVGRQSALDNLWLELNEEPENAL